MFSGSCFILHNIQQKRTCKQTGRVIMEIIKGSGQQSPAVKINEIIKQEQWTSFKIIKEKLKTKP